MRVTRVEQLEGLERVGIQREGTAFPHESLGWYAWGSPTEYGFTTLLSCARQWMTIGNMNELDQLLHRVYTSPMEYDTDDIMVTFRPEPENEYDPDAIQVYSTIDGVPKCLGYIPGKAGGYLNRKILRMMDEVVGDPTRIRAAIIEVAQSCNAPGGRTANHNVVLRIWAHRETVKEEVEGNELLNILRR